MNWDRIAGNWKQASGWLQKEWGKLSDDDLAYVEGRRDQLVGILQERYGIRQDEADRQIDDWLARQKPD